jgi:hypothetical protein|nr:MAG TPA: hypothetical protein [Caudoviricetes sp.]
MKLLVNKQECSKYLSVSLFRKEEEFNRFIREAQMFDFKGLVCESFFQDLTSETPVRDYTLLLEGGSYTFEGKKYEFAGLKAVLSYFAYARYVFVGHQVDTPMGIKEKVNQDGEAISQNERRDVRTMYKQQADLLWQDCERYLERNATLFPEYRCNSGCGESNRINKHRMRMQLI